MPELKGLDIGFFILVIAGMIILSVIRRKIVQRQIQKRSDSLLDNKNVQLRNEYIKLHGGSRMTAAAALDRQIEALKKKHPNKDISWCIEKAIHDLKRDRRG